mgnify:CR=1 FL=1
MVTKNSFYCSRCGVLSKQIWFLSGVSSLEYVCEDINTFLRRDHTQTILKKDSINFHAFAIAGLVASQCDNCDELCLWRNGEIAYPSVATILPPNDLPEECLADFQEAVVVRNGSPRAGAALLRACLEKLLMKITGKDNPSEAIRLIAQAGADPTVIKSMEILRITGNKALHGYAIAADGDNAASFSSLVELISLIIEERITRPKRVEQLYNNLPKEEREKADRKNGT